MRRLPPLNALRAFEATARLEGIQKASEELHVTHGAISRHVKQLEDWLGVTLFDRSQRNIRLNPAGKVYLDSIASALAQIETASQQVQHLKPGNTLGLATTHSFATKWLMNKLPDFYKNHPEIDVWISLDQKRTNFEQAGIDIAIRMGAGPWPDRHCVALMTDRLIPVCSPQLIEGGNRLASVEDLEHHTLLHDLDPDAQWSRWFSEHFPDCSVVEHGPRYTSADILLSSAMSGQGIALVSEVLAAEDLAQGRLIQPLPQSVALGDYFWLVMPVGNQQDPLINTFREWLFTQVPLRED